MAPSMNDIRMHGCLVFHVVPESPTRRALVCHNCLKSNDIKDMSKERRFLKT